MIMGIERRFKDGQSIETIARIYKLTVKEVRKRLYDLRLISKPKELEEKAPAKKAPAKKAPAKKKVTGKK
jgi:hypothetical protein